MLNRSELKRAWNSIHQEKPSTHQPEEGIVVFAQSLDSRRPMYVLDAGCGRGRNAHYLSQQGFKVCGCDLSLTAIKIAKLRARKSGPKIDYQVADLTQLPYSNDQFAIAICVHVLPYNLKSDLVASIHEMWRVLQPEGWLYLDLLDCEDAEYGCGPELEENTFLDQDNVPVHFSSRQEMEMLLSQFTVRRQSRLEYGSATRPRVVWEIWATKNRHHLAGKGNGLKSVKT